MKAHTQDKRRPSIGYQQLFSEISIRITSTLTDIRWILCTPREEQVQCFFTLIFLLSTITAASGRIFSPSLGMCWWLKDSDMNRDVITFSSGWGWMVSQLVRLSLWLPGAGTKYEVMNPFVFVLQTIQKTPLKDTPHPKWLFTMNYWKGEKRPTIHRHTQEAVAAVCHLWQNLWLCLAGEHEPPACGRPELIKGRRWTELTLPHNKYLEHWKWLLAACSSSGVL